MLAYLMKMVMACWRPVERYAHMGSQVDRQDALLWFRDLNQHSAGEFSMAAVQANSLLEDQCQVETGPYGTFVGIYDGHGGPEAARYINEHLFPNLKRVALEQGGMSVDVFRRAFLDTEDGFLGIVQRQWQMKPQIAAVGSCCLASVISGNTLYVASLGDSRAVLGSSMRSSGGPLSAVQISTEHNAAIESVRQELQALHPDDNHIVVLKHGVWRVKGIIQVSRSIGDVYLKKPEYNQEPLFARFRLPEPLRKPVLSADPTVSVRVLKPQDQFVILASDGLWEHLSNQEAVNIVQNSPRTGIARKLIKSALMEAAKKREMRYSDLKKIERGVRRHFHDDITVVVVFFDHDVIRRGSSNTPSISVKGGSDPVGATSTPSEIFTPCAAQLDFGPRI